MSIGMSPNRTKKICLKCSKDTELYVELQNSDRVICKICYERIFFFDLQWSD